MTMAVLIGVGLMACAAGVAFSGFVATAALLGCLGSCCLCAWAASLQNKGVRRIELKAREAADDHEKGALLAGEADVDHGDEAAAARGA
mmetsp:Transcript_10843/g.32193  ORF Transcript_10843/g.32193 Transcript_10843/m.32193 type:complete len:89 (+) Transcript_10843:252-518(+)